MYTKTKFAIGALLLAAVIGITDAIFGCRHKNYSFPQSVPFGKPRSKAATPTGTYVVCLDCGREFAYDWRDMKIIK